MKIHELQQYAKDNGFDTVKFSFVNLKNETINGRWLDAYFGMFRLDGNDGFITVKQWIDFTGDVFDFTIIEN